LKGKGYVNSEDASSEAAKHGYEKDEVVDLLEAVSI